MGWWRSGVDTGDGGGGGGTAPTVEWGPEFGSSPSTIVVSMDHDITVEYEPSTIRITPQEAYEVIFEGFGPAISQAGDMVVNWSTPANNFFDDGPNNWSQPQDALGEPDSFEAFRSGQVAASTDAVLRLLFPDPPTSMNGFTIESTEVRFYIRQTGTVLNNGGMILEYRLDPAAVSWESIALFADNQDFTVTPYVASIPVTTFQQMRDLQVRVRAELALGTNLVLVEVDAAKLIFRANKTL